MIFYGSNVFSSLRYPFITKFLTCGPISFLSKFMTDLIKSSLFNQALISFQSGFSAFLLNRAITGSKANLTASGGLA